MSRASFHLSGPMMEHISPISLHSPVCIQTYILATAKPFEVHCWASISGSPKTNISWIYATHTSSGKRSSPSALPIVFSGTSGSKPERRGLNECRSDRIIKAKQMRERVNLLGISVHCKIVLSQLIRSSHSSLPSAPGNDKTSDAYTVKAQHSV